MSRKKCRRKVWGLVNPIQHAIDGASITPGHLLDRHRLMVAELVRLGIPHYVNRASKIIVVRAVIEGELLAAG